MSVLDALACSLSKDALKRGYPNISLTMSLTVYNFGNRLTMNVIFFLKCSKLDENFENGEKN